MKSKICVFNVFLEWKNMAETQTAKKMKHLKTNNGGEFCNNHFLKLCQDEGIVSQFIVKDTPQHNGGGRTHESDIVEENSMYVVQCWVGQGILG